MTDLATIVYDTVQTFPRGSPIIADDIRFAATVDGHDMSPYSNIEIAHELAKWCHRRASTYSLHYCCSYYRRADA